MLHRSAQTFIILLLLLLVSCNGRTVFQQQYTLKGEQWFKDAAVRFEFDVPDSLQLYDFELNLRNSTDYRFSNLFLFLTTRFPNGNTTRDTLECVLAASDGRWLGKGWGRLKDNHITLKENLRFPVTGSYVFYVQQAMRMDTLYGISEIGIHIQQAKAEE